MAVFASLLVAVPLASPASAAPPTLQEAAAALDVSLAGISPDADGRALLASTQPLAGFPTAGSTYLVLSTGDASQANDTDVGALTSTVLDGPNNSQGTDQTSIRLRAAPPAGTTCLRFDFAFFSEEYPDYVNEGYNDTFTAEQNGSNLTLDGQTVIAPNNFAYDAAGNPITIDSTLGSVGNTGTAYSGWTGPLTATAIAEPNDSGELTITLTLQDLGDSIFDSAVFVDNLRWSSGSEEDCRGGVTGLGDADGDALLDEWERQGGGLDANGDGSVDLDLYAMGARPDHADVFVEIDWMELEACFVICRTDVTLAPGRAALAAVASAFAEAPVANPDGQPGINLHVDAGPGSIMNASTGETWGGRSQGSKLAWDEELGQIVNETTYLWSEFAELKAANFEAARNDVFHYAVWANQYANTTISGASRGTPASDFFVARGETGSGVWEAATFMHELGHNLGLSHGGSVADALVNWKPNYLSVMNYLFQRKGLIGGGLDYSRAELDPLDENVLNEIAGLGPQEAVSGLGTSWSCPDALSRPETNDAAGPIDWNCSGALEPSVASSINYNPLNPSDVGRTVLRGYNDWPNLRFSGGAIGALGNADELPIETPVDEPEVGELPNPQRDFELSISGPEYLELADGGLATTVLQVTNTGRLADSVNLSLDTEGAGIAASGAPPTVALQPGAVVDVPVLVRDTGASPGQAGTVRLVGVSSGDRDQFGEANVPVTILPTSVLPGGEERPPVNIRSIDAGCPPGQVPPDGFGDVSAASVHRAAISCIAWWAVTLGRTPGSFEPSVATTRGEMASFLTRILGRAGVPLPTLSGSLFPDDDGSVHETAIGQLAALGIAQGFGEGSFRPGQPVSRDQMASFVARTIDEVVGPPATVPGDYFSDDEGNVHQGNINRLASLGVTGGQGGLTYNTAASTSREQMASFLARTLDFLVVEGRAQLPA